MAILFGRRLLAGALILFATSPQLPAQQPEALIRSQIAAGEFAPALAAVRAMPDPQRRDGLISEIAVAQARSGNRGASLRSASEIDDAYRRADALSQVAAEPLGGQGGAGMADFDSLIDLITTTVQPTSWDTVGGPGSIAPFATGVYVDAQGVLRPLLQEDKTGRLAALRSETRAWSHWTNARRGSKLRMVSLPRLEREVQILLAAGREPTEEMQLLAGLERITHVFVYPDSGDLVLAGPGGNWQSGDENRILGAESGQPVLRLDDLVVVLRHMSTAVDPRFGCLIKPRQEALARVQTFLQQPQTFNGAGQRRQWVDQLRDCLGKQDIEVDGLDAGTRAAAIMVEADYRMKLVGMGIEEGVSGVTSYLDLVKIPAGEAPPPMGVLRWWFTLNYEAVRAAEDRLAFSIHGPGLKVLSENELLTEQGERIHTGKSETLNRQFAQSFTDNFEELCRKYPIYAELRNIADLALVGAIIRSEDLAAKTGWQMSFFGDPAAYPVQLGEAPSSVETVANHRVIRSGNQLHTLAGVSGGVRIEPGRLAELRSIETERYGELTSQHNVAKPNNLPREAWWWD